MLDEVKALIASHFGRPTDNIDANATFAELGGDDLDLVEITMDVEDELNLAIRDERLVAESTRITDRRRLLRIPVDEAADIFVHFE